MEGKTQGKVIFVNPVTKPTEKLSKRSFGLDCSIEYKGRKINDYLQIDCLNDHCNLLASKDEDGYATSTAIKEGDEVSVEVEVGNYMTNTDKNQQPIIYNNVKLVSIKRINTAAALNHTPSAAPAQDFALPGEKTPF